MGILWAHTGAIGKSHKLMGILWAHKNIVGAIVCIGLINMHCGS